MGRYSASSDFLAGGAVTNGPLTALADGNGVYRYGSSSGFPSQSHRSTNYWVDVVFTTQTGQG